jgi:5-methylcytosine-specific restriction endonuclease McrA
LREITFDEIELIEVGNDIAFVGTIWLNRSTEEYYILPVGEDLGIAEDKLGVFIFAESEQFKFLNQAWLLESRRYTGYKDKATKIALSRVSSNIDPQIRWKVFRRDNFICCYCGYDQGEVTYDHYIPVTLGGSTTVENGRTACRRCNHAKADMPPGNWLNSGKLKKIKKWRKKQNEKLLPSL